MSHLAEKTGDRKMADPTGELTYIHVYVHWRVIVFRAVPGVLLEAVFVSCHFATT